MPGRTYAPYGGKSKRDYYETLFTMLRSDRSSYDAHWSELGEWISPKRVRFTSSDRNRGDKRRQSIIDSTASFAHRTLQSGMHAGLTSPARPWFKLGTPDPELAKFGPVKQWLHEVTQRMSAVFAQSNLYNALPIVYGDLGTFGTAAMCVIEDARDLMRCYTYPIGSYVLALDSRGRASVFIREFELTVRQIVEQYGGPDGQPVDVGDDIAWEHISPEVKALWDEGTTEHTIPMMHAIAPNPEADPERLDAKYLPWTSCHFERNVDRQNGNQRDRVLRESGFRSFPILAPRWDITGEDTYGTECPGMIALGDAKQLQLMQRKKAQALAKMVDPPLVGPTALKTQKTSLLPGDVTYVDQREGMSGLRSIHEIGINFEHLVMDIREVQYRIQRAYYEDLFLMLAQSDPQRGSQPITAREVEERHEEKLLALGPVIERSKDELHDPLIDRCYDLMDDAGLIPPPPEELQGVTLRVEYISIMHQAQKLVGVVGQDRFLQTMLPLYEPHPELRHKIDVMRMADNYADMLGVDPNTVVPTEEAEEAAAAEAQQAAMAQSAATAKDLASAAQGVGQIPIGQGDTVLDRVLSGVGA
jgi:hypothetical protein